MELCNSCIVLVPDRQCCRLHRVWGGFLLFSTVVPSLMACCTKRLLQRNAHFTKMNVLF